jgi:hypothetical protein
MTKCYSCGLEYDWGSCPRCKSFKNIDKQTKLQEKQFKMQGGGSAGGGCVAALVTGVFQLLAMSLVAIIKLEAEILRRMFNGVKMAHDRNPDKFWFYIKRVIFVFFGTAFAIAVIKVTIGVINGTM